MDDFPLTFEQLEHPRVAVIGSRSLQRYTTEILAKGFGELGWDIVSFATSKNRLYQIHGAPHAFQDDQTILNQLASESGDARCVVLIHRPDEVMSLHPQLSTILHALPGPKKIALLGDIFCEHDYYTKAGCSIEVVPHGFFSTAMPINPPGKVVIGTHTTWGEMRLTKHAVEIVVRVLALSDPGTVVGYLGGIPHAELREVDIAAFIKTLNLHSTIEVAPSLGHVQSLDSKRVLVVNPCSVENAELQPTFNVQLYVLDGGVRLGESSGSVHVRVCIPVIFEANGIERVEKLCTVRIPYTDSGGHLAFDMESAASEISELVQSNRYIELLEKNGQRARENAPVQVASHYARLFSELECRQAA